MRLFQRVLYNSSPGDGLECEQKMESIEVVCPQCLGRENGLHECGVCYTCCRCYVCLNCASISPLATCGACRCCGKCCQCFSCKSCKRVFTQETMLCESCGSGMKCGCCIHIGEVSVEKLRIRNVPNLARYAVVEGTLRLPSTRLIAAEIEICGFNKLNRNTFDNIRTIMQGWGINGVSDGSLPFGGIELNTHPAAGTFFIEQTNNICDALGSAKAWVNGAAGCHMHIDCRDLGYYSLAKVLRLLGCVEAGLYALIPKWRSEEERYCQYWAPMYLLALRDAESKFAANMSDRKMTLMYRRVILHALYGFTSKDKISAVKRGKSPSTGSRYRGTNVHSFLHRGTIEFRMPAGTVLADTIINWGALLANLIDVAHIQSMEDTKALCKTVEQQISDSNLWSSTYRDLPKKFKDASFALLKSIAPTVAIKDWMEERRRWACTQTDRSRFLEG